MATKTTNYGLEKPDGTDFYDVDVQNSNMDIIDKQMKANANAITQLNSDMSGFRFTWIRLSGTSNSDGIIWCGETGIDLKNVEWIDCLSNTFSNNSLHFGMIILEAIEGTTLRFRLAATNNTVFQNYSINKRVLVAYKLKG